MNKNNFIKITFLFCAVLKHATIKTHPTVIIVNKVNHALKVVKSNEISFEVFPSFTPESYLVFPQSLQNITVCSPSLFMGLKSITIDPNMQKQGTIYVSKVGRQLVCSTKDPRIEDED